MNNNKKIKNILISVSNTYNIISFLTSLKLKKINLFATTGTANFLKKSNIKVTQISEYTNLPEIMSGRIKTLHHKIFAGLLYRPEHDSNTINNLNIITMDMVIVNFYPFLNTSDNTNLKLKKIIEHIDIGGPAIVRASAKNYKNIIIITQPSSYESILKELNENNNKISNITRFNLAIQAFEYTQQYDKKIYHNLLHKNNKQKQTLLTCQKTVFNKNLNLQISKKQHLNYGENNNQIAAWYTFSDNSHFKKTAKIQQIQGNILSYNNLLDIDSAIECIQEFNNPTCVIIKHGTPCGIATSKNNTTAYISAYKTDPISAFGGIIIFNQTLCKDTAQTIINTQFVEIIIAPNFDSKVNKILIKKPNLKLIIFKFNTNKNNETFKIKSIFDGLLIQTKQTCLINSNNWKIVSNRKPNDTEIKEAIFATKIVKHVKSNAIVFTKNNKTLGIGTGQTSRIDSIKNAINKATENNQTLINSTVASDAFFPFNDGINILSQYNVKCIIQPGGSIRDKEVISSVNKHNLIMIFTNIRYFKH